MTPLHELIGRCCLLVLLCMPELACDSEGAGNLQMDGIWISRDEIAALPMEGAAWEHVLEESSRPLGKPDLSDQDDLTDTRTLAKALVSVRTQDAHLRYEVIDAIRTAMGTEKGGRTLALGRNLMSYVIAADLVGLPPEEDEVFRSWLRDVLDRKLHGKTLRGTSEKRPNNWGTHALSSRAAIAGYLRDQAEMQRVARIFKGWLGDTQSYDDFEYGDLSWQADPKRPVGINPEGASRDGHSIDGVLPDDQRRAGGFAWPPPKENYVYGALQGALATAVILHRAGYDVWEWQDRALLRSFVWLRDQADYLPEGDDVWEAPLVDFYYGTHFWDGSLSRPGKNMGWTEWTHVRHEPSPPAE